VSSQPNVSTAEQTSGPRSLMTFLDVLETVTKEPGQGRLLEQIEKIVRAQQRERLCALLVQIDEKKLQGTKVLLEFSLPQKGKCDPAINRFVILSWKRYDEIYWRALVDYTILALRTFKDIDYSPYRGKITLHYFDIPGGTQRVQDVIWRIVCLIDSGGLSTDFTRSRWMEEWQSTFVSMSRQEILTAASIIEIAPKMLPL
jgi:hypothetical protein